MSLPLRSFAINYNPISYDTKNLNSKVEQVFNGADKYEIDKVKAIKDFSNHTLLAVECLPKGYFIYDERTDYIIEYSEDAISPYYGLISNLYYGGPSYYYVYRNGVYEHTVLSDEELSGNQVSYLSDKFKKIII